MFMYLTCCSCLAEISVRDKKIEALRELIEQLPEINREILELLIAHLNR